MYSDDNIGTETETLTKLATKQIAIDLNLGQENLDVVKMSSRKYTKINSSKSIQSKSDQSSTNSKGDTLKLAMAIASGVVGPTPKIDDSEEE